MFESKIYDALYKFKANPCLQINNQTVSYGEFGAYVSMVQSRIFKEGCQRAHIGIVMQNDIFTYASVIGVLLSGSAYFVINPDVPQTRNEFIVKNAEARLVLSSIPNLWIEEIASSLDIPFALMDKTPIFGESNEIKLHNRNSDELAYILFTSGSTGVPKGVQISTGNLDAVIDSLMHLGIELTDNDRVLQMFDLTFDVSVAMLVIPLLHGSCIYPVPSGDVKYLSAFKLAVKNELTVLCIVPSMLAYLRRYFEEIILTCVRLCILTAEASMFEMVEEWSGCIPNAKIWNLYGPTEATIWSLAHQWSSSDSKEFTYNSMIPIGKPLKNVEAAVFGADGAKVTEINVKGELYLSGPQISCGYLNDQATTLRSFIHDPNTGHIYYMTGDVVYYNNNKDIQYCGRIDNQLQFQGYRVELSEIEHYSRQFSNTGNVIAIGWENQAKVQTIVLFIEKANSEAAAIMNRLKVNLPYYMLPSRIICLDWFPLNNSSKIDRKGLEKQLDVL